MKTFDGTRWTGTSDYVVNVKDFGAVGDGINEDHIGVQLAIDYIDSLGGGTLYFPPGEYYFRSLVDLCDNLNIQGYGATIRKKKATDSPYAAFRGKSGEELGYGSGVNNVRCEGLTFRGNYSVERSICAFTLHRATNVLVQHCNFIEASGSGHVFDLAGCDTVTIQNCIFRGHQLGEVNPSVTTECVQLDQSKRGSVSSASSTETYDGSTSKNITIDNCKFLPLILDGVIYPCPNPLGNHSSRVGAWYENIKFTNNTIVDPVEDTSSSSSKQQYRGNVHLVGNVRKVLISGNTWISSLGSSVRILGIYGISRGNPIDSDPNVQEATEEGNPTYPSDIIISNNTLHGFQGELSSNHTIFVQYLGDSNYNNGKIKGISITDNQLVGRTGSLSEFRLRDTTSAKIIGNSFTSNGVVDGPAISIAFTGKMIISGNIAEGYSNLVSEAGTPSAEELVVNNNIPST